MKYKLVYFDDQPENIDCFKVLLKDHFEVIGQLDSSNYEEVLLSTKPHAYLIDLHMPGVDGLELLKKIKKSPLYNGCPIFFISGDQSDASRISSLNSGAVDFLDRNVNEKELKLRFINKIKLYLQGVSVLEVGNLKLDMNSYTAFLNQKAVDLTLLEMRLICLLLRNVPDPVHKQEISEKIWAEGQKKDAQINVHISNLNMKLVKWDHEIRIIDGFVSVVTPPQ